MIQTAEQFFHAYDHPEPAKLACQRKRIITPAERSIRNDVQAQAEVNHGRWIVPCPWCPSAQIGSPKDPRFFCADCLNNDEGMWIRVVYPSGEDAKAIAKALHCRRDPTHCNWVPQESVDDLIAENEAHGVMA